MKTNDKSEISRAASHGRARVDRLVTGSEKNGGAAVSGFVPAAPSSTPVLQGGRIVFPSAARRARTVRLPLAMPPHLIAGWITVPAVLDEIELQRRLAIVKATAVMKAAGISQNKAAKALGVPGSALSAWINAFATRGEEGLRPKPWNGGRKPASGRQSRGNAFFEIRLR